MFILIMYIWPKMTFSSLSSHLTPLISINISFLHVICFLLTSNCFKSCETISIRNYKKSRGKLVLGPTDKTFTPELSRTSRATGYQTLSDLHQGYNKLLHGKITVEHFLSKEFDLCRQPDIMRYLPRILLRAGNTRKYLKYFSLARYLMKFTACH